MAKCKNCFNSIQIRDLESGKVEMHSYMCLIDDKIKEIDAECDNDEYDPINNFEAIRLMSEKEFANFLRDFKRGEKGFPPNCNEQYAKLDGCKGTPCTECPAYLEWLLSPVCD